MKIFIPRLPTTVSVNELRQLAGNLLDKKLHLPFTTRPSIVSCDILCMRDNTTGVVEHHGVISIRPDSAGRWFLNHFRNQHIHKKMILAREYIERESTGQPIRPENDLRRKQLTIEKYDVHRIKTAGLKQFVKSHFSD